MRIFQSLILGTMMMAGAFAPNAMTQTAEPTGTVADETKLHGKAELVSKTTMVVTTPDHTHQLFVFDSDTIRPVTIVEGAEVTVTSVPSGEAGVRLARIVKLGAEPVGQASTPQASPIPAETQRLQKDIERHMRNIEFGAQGGIGLDPEVVIVGVHARMGPLFHRDIQFRPSADFGFGEVTKFFDVNADVSYRLPLTPRWSTWSTYLAAGPSFGFSQQNFERANAISNGGAINWSNLEFTPGLNIVAGMESRRGFLIELRSTIYSSPNPIFRMMFGYNF